MGNGALAIGPKLPRLSSTLPSVWTGRALQAENDDLEGNGSVGADLSPPRQHSFELVAMSCVSRHQGRTAWCLPARIAAWGNGGDCGQDMRGRLFVKEGGDAKSGTRACPDLPERCCYRRD